MHELTDVNWINKERQACFSDQSEKNKKTKQITWWGIDIGKLIFGDALPLPLSLVMGNLSQSIELSN